MTEVLTRKGHSNVAASQTSGDHLVTLSPPHPRTLSQIRQHPLDKKLRAVQFRRIGKGDVDASGTELYGFEQHFCHLVGRAGKAVGIGGTHMRLFCQSFDIGFGFAHQNVRSDNLDNLVVVASNCQTVFFEHRLFVLIACGVGVDIVPPIGMFGNQNTVCKPTTPKWRSTVERLKTHFPAHNKN